MSDSVNEAVWDCLAILLDCFSYVKKGEEKQTCRSEKYSRNCTGRGKERYRAKKLKKEQRESKDSHAGSGLWSIVPR